MPTALVLSAGGMFGAYQAGAWKALAGRLPLDVVVGASVGSLNAWAIAGGCSPENLIAEWMNPENRALNHLRFPFPPWSGCLHIAPLARRIASHFANYRPKIRLGITMVQVPRLRRTLICDDAITADHVRASCAVPFGYPPVRLDGKLYVDGGLLETTPVWAAVELGATQVVVINVLAAMPNWAFGTAVRAFRAVAPRGPRFPELHRIDVSPAVPLGPLRSTVTWDEDSIRRWIEQGERDAEAALMRLPRVSAK
jgi:NTE family protein